MEAPASEENDKLDGNEKPRPRSASFSGVTIDTKDSPVRKSTSTKKRRSNSMGHKVKRRGSFIRLFKAAREIGRTLGKIGDDLESRHSHSSQSLCSQLQ